MDALAASVLDRMVVDSTKFQQLLAAAQSGDSTAQSNLGVTYLNGTETPQNFGEAVKWLTLAVRQNNPAAQYALSACYAKGIGVERNDTQSLNLLIASAAQGYLDAVFKLGGHYYSGTGGASKNPVESAKCFRLAAARGHVQAQYSIAVLVHEGQDGLEQNKDEAFAWFLRAAEQGHVDAMFAVAEGYWQGTGGIDRDVRLSSQWYLRAAEAGHARAQFEISQRYKSGTGLEENPQEALKWLQRSADGGNVTAQFDLALLFTQASKERALMLVPQDFSAAAKYFAMAAKKGHVKSQHALAGMYRKGQGVERNDDIADRLYEAALNAENYAD